MPYAGGFDLGGTPAPGTCHRPCRYPAGWGNERAAGSVLTHLSSRCRSDAAGSHLPSFHGFPLRGGHLQRLLAAARALSGIPKCLLFFLRTQLSEPWGYKRFRCH